MYSRYTGYEPELGSFNPITMSLDASEALWVAPCWWHSVSGARDTMVYLFTELCLDSSNTMFLNLKYSKL